MKPSERARRFPKAFLMLLAAMSGVFLSSCADQAIRTTPPPSGMGVLDTTPEAFRRDRISDMRIAAVNGHPAKGDEAELSPGNNRVRVKFSWPQGGEQEVDLDFKVRSEKIYAVYCEVDPPLSQHSGTLERGTAGMLAGANDPMAPFVAGLGVAAVSPFLVAEKSATHTRDHSVPARYVDVMVVAQRSPEGIVCTRRVYPGGKIEKR
jgi:hypothetical protein